MFQSWKHAVLSNSHPLQTWRIPLLKLTERMTRRLQYQHPGEEVLIWEPVTGWEIPFGDFRCGVGCVAPSRGHMRAAARGDGRTFPCAPSSCHGNDQLSITCMHALPCLRAHSPSMLCSQGKIYIPSLAQKGSTPLPGSPCHRQEINWVIFPALLMAVGREAQKAPSVANLLQDELSITSPQGLLCSHEHQKPGSTRLPSHPKQWRKAFSSQTASSEQQNVSYISSVLSSVTSLSVIHAI